MVHKSIYQIAMVTLIGSILWTGFEVYSSLNKTDYVEIDKEMLTVLDPYIDEETVNNIFTRRQVMEGVDLSILNTPIVETQQIEVATEASEGAHINDMISPESPGL